MGYYLLLTSLGPIQDFIQSARKCQDLWFGSWMLSDLARATANSFRESAGGDEPLIFPGGLSEDGRGRSVANKILAVFQTKHGTPEAIAEKGKDAMLKRLHGLADTAYSRLNPSFRESFFREDVARLQLNELMEYAWVSVPLENMQGYSVARDAAERLLSQRKATRNWGPVSWTHLAGQGVPKSSLDGFRESVIHEDLYEELTRAEAQRNRRRAAQLRNAFYLKAQERLCGIALLKRIGAEPFTEDTSTSDSTSQEEKPPNVAAMFGHVPRPTFHSTSHMATVPLLTKIHQLGESGTQALQSYFGLLEEKGIKLSRYRISPGGLSHAFENDLLSENAFDFAEGPASIPRTFQQGRNYGYDGSLLFESRLEECLEESEVEATPAKINELRHACRRLLGRGGLGVGEPTPYYAFLLADGDRMGAALDALTSIEAHRDVSQALSAFTDECTQIVPAFGGSLIYAGGDDVLALLPLHSALQCALRLKEAFQQAVAACFADVADAPNFRMPTLSVGLGVAHHLEPMGEARELAKRAERLAKDAGRNSLAIAISKRSGADLEVVGSWSEEDPLHKRIAHWARLLDAQILPHGAAYKLESMLSTWEIQRGEYAEEEIVASIVSLAHRIIDRSRSHRGATTLVETAATAMRIALESDERGESILARIRHLSHEIQVARLFLQARNDAFSSSLEHPVTNTEITQQREENI